MVQKDKKLVKHLQRQYSNENIIQAHVNKNHNVNPEQLNHKLNQLTHVSVGNLNEFSTVRLLSYFISTLNTTYTDFDFTLCEPNQFVLEKPKTVNETINARLAPLTKSKPLLMNSFWKTINSIMDLEHCNFYSFTPNDDVMQALRPHSLWNIDYFVLNVKKKQLMYLSFYARNSLFRHENNDSESKEDMCVDIAMDESVNDGMEWLDKGNDSPPKQKNRNNFGNGKNKVIVNNFKGNNGNQLQVMSINNCLDTMPMLERPNDM